MQPNIIIEPEAAAQVQEAEGLALQCLQVPRVVIRTEPEYRAQAATLVDLKGRIKDLESKRTAITKPINDGLKAINAMFKGATEQLEQALRVVESPMKAYVQEQDRLRREAEESARKEQERIRLEQEEAQRKAEEEFKAARERENALKRLAVEELDPVAALLAESEAEEAAAASQEAMEAVKAEMREAHRLEHAPLVTAIAKPMAAGTSVRRNWKYEITDESALPRTYLVPNEQLIGAAVRSLKDKTNIPGIRVYEDLTIGSR